MAAMIALSACAHELAQRLSVRLGEPTSRFHVYLSHKNLSEPLQGNQKNTLSEQQSENHASVLLKLLEGNRCWKGIR